MNQDDSVMFSFRPLSHDSLRGGHSLLIAAVKGPSPVSLLL